MNPFDAREATISNVHDALFTQGYTCRDVVSSFLSRIERFNPTINALISLNEDALSVADQMDARIRSGSVSGSLFCVPILLKDNFDAVGMKTTGGSSGLAHNQPTADAPSVKALRNAGAIVLGKTNLHELALEGLTVSSLGGQTANPYDLTRTPGGSSGGTGAAIAAGFAVLGTGTDTMNSLRSPASANSLFSFRPTRGLITRSGVIPVSYTQDTVGVVARNTRDLAITLDVMAGIGFDPADNTTALAPPEVRRRDYVTALEGGGLEGVRLGFVNGFLNHTHSAETTPVLSAMKDMISALVAAGAEIINITEAIYDSASIAAALDVQTSEYRESLDSYLSNRAAKGARPGGFVDLYSGRDFLVIPTQYNFINAAFASSTSDANYHAKLRGIQNLTLALRTTFASHRLDALIYPQQKNLVVRIGASSQSGRNGILAALTGSPVVTVPAGFSPSTAEAPVGVPIGMEILGLPWSEGALLNIADHVTKLMPTRKTPPFANALAEPKCYHHVPEIRPDTGNIPAEYAIGVF